ncbi:MAG TPA: hypothetical protein VLC09_02605, partial [Polyangiaceae bacterium]|nr:hypothetical protein [Polyangiaceae bacterium]
RLSYLAGGHHFQAALTAKQQMSSVGVSITRYDQCVALSVDDSELCVEGYVGATEEAWPIDAALARHVLEHAKRVIPNDDWAADYLARMESAAASVALRVGDRDYFESMRAGAQPFLADPARHAVGWWNFLGSAANSSLHVDEGLAFQLAEEALALDLQGGARSYALWRWVGHADSHGRGALADRLQAQGLAGSKAWKHRFTLRGVRQLVARGEYEEAAKRYRKAIETTVETGVAQREPGEYFLLRASLAQALALRGDLSGAEKELVSLTHDVAQSSAEARPICLESAVLDVAASVASARKDCARAESLRAASELQAAACRGAATHVEGWAFADRPALLGFRSEAACGDSFAPHERLFAGPGPSPEEARRMSELACERGVRKSCDVLPMVEGKPELLEEACQQGWGRPCATRAEQLVKTEPARALGLAHEACERDWAAGCVLEATGLAEGWGGTPVQPQSSLRKLDRACELGQLEACALYIERGGKFLGDP